MRADRYICLSTFFSNWGERSWQFAVGIYLVKLTPGSLQLAAIYGLVVSFSAIIFSSTIGDWIDRNARLKVVRILLILGNLLVILSAIFVLIHLAELTKNSRINFLLKLLIIAAGSSASLAGEGQKIVVGKDWVVVVSKGSKKLLTVTNSVIRRIDLTVAILAPLCIGLLMTLISDAAGIILICTWNFLSMICEYLLLLKVYRLVPELADKMSDNKFGDVAMNTFEEENTRRAIEKVHLVKGTSSWSNVLARFKAALLGWKVYKRQTVFLAGCSIFPLYLSVLNTSSLTVGYAYVVGLSGFYVSLFVGLASAFGVFSSFIFPKLTKRIGLVKTGLVAFFMQWSMLFLCVISIWLPGSQSKLYSGAKADLSPVKNSNTSSSAILNVTLTTTETHLLNITTGNRTSMLSPPTTGPTTPTKNLTSIIVLLVGIILSRTGLWIRDLTVTQIQQENIPEEERGVVGGVQHSLNCILDLLRYALTIALPYHDQFGYLILISFSAITCSGIIYSIFYTRFTRDAAASLTEEN